MIPDVVLVEAERRRDKRRDGRRIAFDCFNLKCDNDRAYCSKGHYLGRTIGGSISLVVILKGSTPSVCKNCADYDDEATSS